MKASAPPPLTPEERARRMHEALHGTPAEQSEAAWALAVSGFSPKAARVLLALACDAGRGEAARDHAAMGLGNYAPRMAAEQREAVQLKLRDTLRREGAATPDGV